MKKAIYIQVPEPCHEDWNKMTSAEQGKHCSVCAKTVVDFSAMSDEEVLSFFSKPRGGTCGNFASDQLDRLIKAPASAPRQRYWAMLFSFLLPLFANKAKSQKMGKVRATTTENNQATNTNQPAIQYFTLGEPVYHKPIEKALIRGAITDTSGKPIAGANIVLAGTSDGVNSADDGSFQLSVARTASVQLQVFAENFAPLTMTIKVTGDTITQKIKLQPLKGDKKPRILCNPPKHLIPKEPATKEIKGNVAEADGTPIPGASVVLKGTHTGTAADNNGNFRITLNNEDQAKPLVVSAVGYQTKEVSNNDDTATLQLKLAQQLQSTLGEVVVVASPQRTVGRLRVCTTQVKHSRSVKDTLKSIISPAGVKIFPNPASTKQFVYVQPTSMGEYQMQLFDMQGQMILQRSFAILMKKQSYQLELPATIAAGTYTVTVFHTASRKVYTQQLIIR